MGTNRLKSGQEERGGTAPLKAKTGKLKPPVKVKPGTGKLAKEAARPEPVSKRQPTGPLRPHYTTAQLRLPPSKRRKTGMSPVLKVFALSAVILGGGAAAALAGAHTFLESLGPGGKGFSLPAVAEGLKPIAEPQNILLLGADYSYAEGHRMNQGPVRSDTLIVAGLDPAHNRVSLISIPRDTRVLIRGHYDKINSALALGGPKLASQVVSNLLGVPIHHWAQVNTRGLERLVDVVGGVRLYVEKDMRYVDRTAGLRIEIPRGWQQLD
ncbi:MAG: LCP family protein, partial [Candidatus Sericytochromatia bacterium]